MRALLRDRCENRPTVVEVIRAYYDEEQMALHLVTYECEAIVDGIMSIFAKGAIQELYTQGKTDLSYYEAEMVWQEE